MSLLLLKQIGLFSVLIGLALGLVSLIPFIGTVLFIFSFLLLSAAIIIYLKRINILGKITIKEGGVLGAVIGFCSIIAFSIVFIPLSAIIQFVFKLKDFWVGMIVVQSFSSVLTFVLLLFLIFFLALLCALMNGFSGAVTAYIYEVLEEYNKTRENMFENNL